MKKIIALSSILLLTGCLFNPENFTPIKPPRHAASRPKITGYGPVKFGMKREEATKALGPMGEEVPIEEGAKPTLYFVEYQNNDEFDVWVFFDKKGDTVNKIELVSNNARVNIRSSDQCLYLFRQYVDTFTNVYGPVDFPIKYMEEEGNPLATAYITFSDSSGVRVYYRFDNAKQECKLSIQYIGPWAT